MPYLKPCPTKRVPLSKIVKQVQKEGRVTIVFGAGVSVALGGMNATWTAFLESLIYAVNDRHVSTCCTGKNASHWVSAEALSHRLHTVRSLAHGDSDAATASTFLIDRIHAVHSQNKMTAWSALARYEDVNKAASAIEDSWRDRSTQPEVVRWNALFARLGAKAKLGRAFLITTNFDHTIARAAALPIYLGAWKVPFGRYARPDYYKEQPEGVVIRKVFTKNKGLWGGAKIAQSNSIGPAPQLFADAWQYPGRVSSISSTWWQDLASVFHVHGSRLIPPSLVFDACSYGKLCEGTPVISSGEILHSHFSNPTASGPVIFAGCKGTLLDPNFIRFWSNSLPSTSHIYVLQKEDEIDPLEREMHGHFLQSPPNFCSFGSAHSDLLKALEKVAQALP